MSQYFENDENVVSNPVPAVCWCGSRKLTFKTDSGVFSKGEIDPASLLLVQSIPPLTGKVLDLGCGYGFIGIYLKIKNPDIEIAFSDVNRRALELAEENCRTNGITGEVTESDGFENIDGSFEAVVLNPPIHAGKEVIYKLYDESYERLCGDGHFYIVIQKKHGAQSSIDHLEQTGFKVSQLYYKKGIYVLDSTKQ